MKLLKLSTAISEENKEDSTDAVHHESHEVSSHLIQLVLDRAEMSTLARFREVSKKWSSYIISAQISSLREKELKHKPVPILVHDGWIQDCKWSIFTLHTLTGWEPYTLSFLKDMECLNITVRFRLSATHGGLICLEGHDGQNIVICNPITKKWRTLPLHDEIRIILQMASSFRNHLMQEDLPILVMTGIFVNPVTGHYKFIVASLIEGLEGTMIYDSSNHSWFKGAPIPPAIKKFGNRFATTCNGTLYVLASVLRISPEEERGRAPRLPIWQIVKYNVEHHKWRQLGNYWDTTVRISEPFDVSPNVDVKNDKDQLLGVARVRSGLFLGDYLFLTLEKMPFCRLPYPNGIKTQAVNVDSFKRVYSRPYPGIGSDWRSADSQNIPYLNLDIRILEPSIIALP